MPPQRSKSGKGRVPDNKRQRVGTSCDRCKIRKARCEQLPTSTTRSCESCAESGVECTFTIPRKTRVYGSVETLSARFRVLQDLVKGLFPDRDTSDAAVLYEIAAERQIEIPDFTANNDTPIEAVFSKIPEGFGGASPASSDASQQTMPGEPTPVARSTTLPSSPPERLALGVDIQEQYDAVEILTSWRARSEPQMQPLSGYGSSHHDGAAAASAGPSRTNYEMRMDHWLRVMGYRS
ncbi:hypothetical protein DSL72_004838 [Monilinia vaccinii-corymbosi]|uniref:Zn(2)-C6 fungal-type domain-containing protein n=1 Tax=Monilinia vaccinii-corymbosi TaxID=61207 RepID=A0A8A3P4S3_9HELO|nr:hypothetical protein DSL72_004838 [Monilinia vaccinii-corymbosi]